MYTFNLLLAFIIYCHIKSSSHLVSKATWDGLEELNWGLVEPFPSAVPHFAPGFP